MNRLLKMSFDKMGYDYDFLSNLHTNYYSGKYLFQDEDKLVLALRDARANNKHVVVLSDFDIDGISAGCTLYGGLSLLGFNVSLYAPNVLNGYGFGFSDIDKILEQWPDTKLILTCDVGIDEKDAIAYAQSKEIWFYVTDHHIEDENFRTTADAIVDPSRNDSNDVFKGVCGAYVAWHVLTVYAAMTENPAIIELIRKLVLFVGLGTCGDVMPVLHDSRNVIMNSVTEFNYLLDCDDPDDYFGCTTSMLPETYTAPFLNLRCLHLWLVANEHVNPGCVDDVSYGFTYCPMFNSVKRMGESMDTLYKMLYQNPDRDFFNQKLLYKWLWDLNQQRKKEVAELMANIDVYPERYPFAPFAYLINARPGILGLVATKLISQSGLPTFVLVYSGNDTISGSGRTPEWFPRKLLSHKGVHVAGHEHHFGISILKSEFMDFMQHVMTCCQALIQELNTQSETADMQTDPRLVLCMNGRQDCGEYDFSIVKTDDYDVCYDYCVQVNKLRPFGNGFPEPEFILRFKGCDIKRVIYMGADKTHLKLELDHNIYLVWFGGAKTCKGIRDGAFEKDDVFSFSGNLQLNEFLGSTTLQFSVNEQIC